MIRNLTQHELIQLQAYKSATTRLNTLHGIIEEAKAAIKAGTVQPQVVSMLPGNEEAYYSTMKYCDRLVSYFAQRGLDAEQLLEQVRL